MTAEDILDSCLPRLAGVKPTCTIFDALRGVQTIVVNRLLLMRSDYLRVADDLDITAGTTNATLPSGYAAMAERPAVVGGNTLTPIQRTIGMSLTTPGDPKFYDTIGSALSVFPPPAENVTVRVNVFARPAAQVLLTDTIPFEGAFDEIYAYGALAALKDGPDILADRGFVALIDAQVDGVLLAKNMTDEQMLADALNDR